MTIRVENGLNLALGAPKRWREGELLYAENDLVRIVYVATDDHMKIGTLGFHGPDKIRVEFISHDAARLWSLS